MTNFNCFAFLTPYLDGVGPFIGYEYSAFFYSSTYGFSLLLFCFVGFNFSFVMFCFYSVFFVCVLILFCKIGSVICGFLLLLLRWNRKALWPLARIITHYCSERGRLLREDSLFLFLIGGRLIWDDWNLFFNCNVFYMHATDFVTKNNLFWRPLQTLIS